MAIHVTFRCGHEQAMGPNLPSAPTCQTCGERQIRRVKAPPPSFRGTVRGPHTQWESLAAIAVNVAPGGALDLKPSKSRDEIRDEKRTHHGV